MRRARGFATWAALRSLGRSGVAELVEGSCALARRLASALAKVDGIEIANDVVLNQVLVRVGDADLTDRLERAIQEDGTCWMGATTWRGERLLRVAVSGEGRPTGNVEPIFNDLVAELKSETDRLEKAIADQLPPFNSMLQRIKKNPIDSK